MDAIDNINKGLEERQTYTSQSKVVTSRGSLHLALLRQERLLLNKCNIRIRLILQTKALYLMSDDAVQGESGISAIRTDKN